MVVWQVESKMIFDYKAHNRRCETCGSKADKLCREVPQDCGLVGMMGRRKFALKNNIQNIEHEREGVNEWTNMSSKPFVVHALMPDRDFLSPVQFPWPAIVVARYLNNQYEGQVIVDCFRAARKILLPGLNEGLCILCVTLSALDRENTKVSIKCVVAIVAGPARPLSSQ